MVSAQSDDGNCRRTCSGVPEVPVRLQHKLYRHAARHMLGLSTCWEHTGATLFTLHAAKKGSSLAPRFQVPFSRGNRGGFQTGRTLVWDFGQISANLPETRIVVGRKLLATFGGLQTRIAWLEIREMSARDALRVSGGVLR